jgi:MFS family permease
MRLPRTFESLRAHRNYRLYFSGQIVSYSGSYVQDTALPWLVLELTHSPFHVGLLVFCRYAPFLVGGLYGGVIADRFDNRRILIATQAFSMLVASALTVVAFSGTARLWPIYLLATCTGLQLIFDNPSKHALIYQLVGREELPNAVALNISLQNVAKVVGPALGGVLIAAFGVGWCFAVNSASFLAVLAGLLLMRAADMFRLDRGETRPSPRRALGEGFAYLRESRQLQVIMGIGAVIGFFGFSAMRTLLSVLAATTLHSGAQTFGALFASYGAGAVAGALRNATASRTSRRRLFAGAGGFSLAVLALAPVHQAVTAGVLLFLCGVGWSTWSSQALAHVQLAAPDRLRGRVISLYTYTILASAPLGGITGGYLAGVGGTGLAFGVAGGSGLAVVTAAALVLRGVRLPGRRAPEVPLPDEVPG